MSQINLKSVILGIEATKGTPPAATSFYKMPINGEAGIVVAANSGSANVLSDSRLSNEEYLTTKSVSGSVAITADYSNIYFPLALGIGMPSAAVDNSDGTYTRVFTPQNTVSTVSIQREIEALDASSTFYELFSGVAIDGWTINVQDERLQAPMNVKGGVASDSNDTGFTPVDVTSAVKLVDTDIRKAHSSLTKGGVAYHLSSTMSIQVGNNVAEKWYIGDGEYPTGLDFGAFTMSGSIEGVFDAAFLKTVKDTGRTDFEVTFTSSANPLVKLIFTLGNVFIKYKTLPYKVGERATLGFDWVADTKSTVSATLTNTVATY